MIDRIGKIIHKDLFRLKLISPDIHGRIIFHTDLYSILFCQDIRRLQIVADQGRDVKTLHGNHIVSEFQLIQSQQFLHHGIHPAGLIHDYLTVKTPALRIVVYALQKPLRITLYQCNGRLQLMGYICQKLSAHLVNFFLPLNVPLQCIVCRFQLRDRTLQRLRQLVDIRTQHSDLVLLPSLIL